MQLNTKRIVTPLSLLSDFPLTIDEQTFIQSSRVTIQNILDGKDKRFLLIVGPCSLHDLNSAMEYAHYLKELSDKVSSHIFIVMRAYVEKPRSTMGWKGFLHDPHLDGSFDLNSGLRLTREFFIKLAKLKLPCAMEFLEFLSLHYIGDLVSWGCIGARTAASQPHRQLASLLPMPVGFKNGVDGNLNVAIQGAIVASHPHVFLGFDQDGFASQIYSKGNPYTHIVLRGGGGKTNYDPLSVNHAIEMLNDHGGNRSFLIDCSHGNSYKNYHLQENVFRNVLNQIAEGNQHIVGAMLESHINEGAQLPGPLNTLKYGVSITDSCIDWLKTEKLVLDAYNTLQQNSCLCI